MSVRKTLIVSVSLLGIAAAILGWMLWSNPGMTQRQIVLEYPVPSLLSNALCLASMAVLWLHGRRRTQ